MRPIGLGRRNSLFTGSEGGAESWAILASLLNTAKLNGLDPQTYLCDVLERIVSGRTKNHQLHELLPGNGRRPARWPAGLPHEARASPFGHPPMTAVAMPLDKLDCWLQGRTGAAATNLPMLDGFVSAIVAGPVSIDAPEWICPLLGIDIDAFNHGGTPEFAAISAVAVRHNAIVETLSTAPKSFEPIFARKPNGDIDPRSWCQGFYAAMKLRLADWARLTNLGRQPPGPAGSNLAQLYR